MGVPCRSRLAAASGDGDREVEQQGLQQQQAEYRTGGVDVQGAPSGGGIHPGVDRVTVRNNDIQNNDFRSPSSTIASRWPARPSTARSIRRRSAVPDDNQVLSNRVSGNGLNLPPILRCIRPTILLPGTGTNNCFSNTHRPRTFPSPFPRRNAPPAVEPVLGYDEPGLAHRPARFAARSPTSSRSSVAHRAQPQAPPPSRPDEAYRNLARLLTDQGVLRDSARRLPARRRRPLSCRGPRPGAGWDRSIAPSQGASSRRRSIQASPSSRRRRDRSPTT
jgi:hypothetical protein